jgi:hypothetical protein
MPSWIALQEAKSSLIRMLWRKRRQVNDRRGVGSVLNRFKTLPGELEAFQEADWRNIAISLIDSNLAVGSPAKAPNGLVRCHSHEARCSVPKPLSIRSLEAGTAVKPKPQEVERLRTVALNMAKAKFPLDSAHETLDQLLDTVAKLILRNPYTRKAARELTSLCFANVENKVENKNCRMRALYPFLGGPALA